MVGVQDEDAVHRTRQHRVRLVVLGRHCVAHAQEVGGVVEIVLRIHERLADRIFVSHGGERRHFRDHADRGDHALGRIRDVGGVVVECRQRADTAGHHRHRVRVAPEALEEPHHLLVHHGVARDAVIEIGFLRGRRQLAVQQQVAGLQEIAVLGQLLDRIAAIEQHALVAVDVGDLRLAACRGGKAGVVGEQAALAIELGNVDHRRTDGAGVDREIPVLVADRERAGLGLVGLGVHGRALELASDARQRCGRGWRLRRVRAVPAAFCVAHSSVRCKIAQVGSTPAILARSPLISFV